MLATIVFILLSLFATFVDAGTIIKPSKSFGGNDFINGVVPQASDFNGDVDIIYGEFNGNIDNNNIKTSAGIIATKINPDGFVVNVRSINASPCTVLDESDQTTDVKRWATCINNGVFQLGTYTDGNILQNNWLTITRANGGFTLGGAGGNNIVNGPTTFNQLVSFTGATTLTPTGMVSMYMGTAPPSGWLLMDGASNNCTGVGAVNSALCVQLISLIADANYKGTGTTVTVDTASDEIVHTNHGHVVNDRVHFNTSSILPSPLAAATVYCIISVTTDRYKISSTCGGASVDILTSGTGIQSDFFNFITPDTRSRTAIGTGAGPGLTTRVIGAIGGAEQIAAGSTGSHTLTLAQIPSHTHGQGINNLVAGGITTVNAPSAASSAQAYGGETFAAGGSTGHSHTTPVFANMDPFLVMTYIIKL